MTAALPWAISTTMAIWVLAAANYNFGSGGIGVWRGNGAGVWNPAMAGLPTTNFNTGIYLADVNHDNNLDLAFGHEGNGVKVYTGNGAGTWAPSSTGLPTSGKYESVWMGDVNHDGNTDLAVAGVGMHIYLGDGAGGWNEASTGLPPTDTWNSVTLGDVNMDGNIDLVAAQDMTGNGLHAWLNDGTSTWTQSSTGLPTVGMYYGVILADLVGDKYPDLLAAGFGDTGVQLWQGNGGSSWVEVTSAVGLPTTGKAIGVAAGDIDNDGYLDVAAVGEGFGVHVWRNAVTSPTPDVTLAQPNGGENWEIGTQHYINWTTSSGTPPSTISLEYSTSGILGPFKPIRAGLADTGNFLWTVPYEPSSDAYVRVNVTDSAGKYNWDKSNASFAMFASDTTPPAISNLRPAGLSVIGNARPLIGADYSDSSGISTSSVVLKVDTVNVTSSATVTASGITYTPPTALPAGVHSIYLEVADNYVIHNKANATWRFTVDTTPPSISNEVPANRSTTADNTPLIGASYGDLAGIDTASVVVKLDTVDVTASATVTTTDVTYVPSTPLADGDHYVDLSVRDKAVPGNLVFVSWWFTVDTTVPDTTPPTITNLLPVNQSLVSDATPTVGASYSDSSGIDVSSVVLIIDMTDCTSAATVTASGVTYHPSAALSDGVHNVYVAVEDASLNHNRAVATWRFTVDTLPPTISSVSPANQSTIGDARPTIEVSYGDASFIDVASIVLKLDSVDVTSSSTIFTSDITYVPPAPLPFGMHNVSIRVSDIAVPPNTATKAWWFIIDNLPPEVTNLKPTHQSITSLGRPLIGADYFDPSGIALVSVSLMVDSINVTSMASVTSADVSYTLSSPLAEGVHDVRLDVCDASSRHNKATVYWQFTVDTVRPTITNLAPENNSATNNRTPVIGASYGDASGIDLSTVTMWVDSADVTSSSVLTATGISFSLTAAMFEVPHDVRLTVGDNATPANRETVLWTFRIDSTPPLMFHTPVTIGEAGLQITVTAQVSDSGGVGSVVLFYRRSGTATYASAPMTKEASGNIYSAIIPGSLSTTDGVQYYIEAIDNVSNIAHRPDRNWASSPYSIEITAAVTTGLPVLLIAIVVILVAVTLAILLLVMRRRRREEDAPPPPPEPGEPEQ